MIPLITRFGAKKTIQKIKNINKKTFIFVLKAFKSSINPHARKNKEKIYIFI